MWHTQANMFSNVAGNGNVEKLLDLQSYNQSFRQV